MIVAMAVSLFLLLGVVSMLGLDSLGARPSGERQARILGSANFREGRFRNLEPTHKLMPGTFWQMLRHQLFGGEQRTPLAPVPVVTRTAADYASPAPSGLRATWVGHASVLVEIDGLRVLVDPIWSERCSPLGFVGPVRFHPPPMALEELPLIDAVLISHDHYDHLDAATVVALARRGAHFAVPLGVGAHLEHWGVPATQVTDLDWYESVTIKGLRLTATPARHYSGRSIHTDSTLWASWAIGGPVHRVFFSGDSGYSERFREVGEKLGPFDLTLVKIGACDPTWQQIHMDPEEAVRTHLDVRGRVLLPVHWGTFNLAYHDWNEPPERALAAARAQGAVIVLPRPGEWFEPSQPPPVETWWREGAR
jgi:L-ascorbate metabolism protein UlaG (beta-lactamase superfamily)